MAIDCLTAPVRAGDDFMVALLARFTGNGSSAPSNVAGKGVSVSRTAAGTYQVTFPTGTLDFTNLRALAISIAQAAGTNYVATWTITSNKVVITVKSGGFVQEAAKTAADSNAGDATAETVLGYAAERATITSVAYVPADTLTADNSNYATLIVSKRASDGGTKTTVASRTTQITGSGDWAAFEPIALTIAVADVAAGSGLTWEITKTGTGVVVPAGVLVVTAKGGAVDLASTETVLVTAWVRDSSQ